MRVIRLPRHGASLPISIAVSCSADRQAVGKITRDGVFLEQLEMNPAQYLPEITETDLSGDVVDIDFLTSPCRDLDRLRSLRSFIRSEAGVPDRANALLHRASLSSKVIL